MKWILTFLFFFLTKAQCHLDDAADKLKAKEIIERPNNHYIYCGVQEGVCMSWYEAVTSGLKQCQAYWNTGSRASSLLRSVTEVTNKMWHVNRQMQ